MVSLLKDFITRISCHKTVSDQTSINGVIAPISSFLFSLFSSLLAHWKLLRGEIKGAKPHLTIECLGGKKARQGYHRGHMQQMQLLAIVMCKPAVQRYCCHFDIAGTYMINLFTSKLAIMY